MSRINKFMKQHNLKNEATSGLKVAEVAKKLGLEDLAYALELMNSQQSKEL